MDKPTPDTEYEENSEQADASAQAHQVAQDARVRSVDLSEDSERGGHSNRAQIIPDDTPDLVERMNAMTRSGHIDMDAYAGEPRMDDEDDGFGKSDDEEDE